MKIVDVKDNFTKACIHTSIWAIIVQVRVFPLVRNGRIAIYIAMIQKLILVYVNEIWLLNKGVVYDFVTKIIPD